MGPERCFPKVERYVVHPNCQSGAFPVCNGMNRREGSTQSADLNLLLGPSSLMPRLRLGHAILNGLHTIPARESRP